MKKLFLTVSALVLFTACDVIEFKDGRIPSDLLGEAKKLEGVYTGRFNGQNSKLTVTFEGDRPILTYTDARGNDLLGPQCGSKIGYILRATGTSKRELNTVTFAFDPGHCSADGKELQLFLYDQNHKIGVRLLDYEYLDHECTIDVPPPPAAPVQRCRAVIRQKYMEGSYIR